MALDLTGRAPLGLINRFIAPRSIQGDAAFDLRLEGRPALDALRGTVTIGNGRLSLPRLNAALGGIGGTIALASGRAETDISGTLGTGGSLRLQGPVTLRPPFPASLRLTLARLGLSDPTLYRTTADGTLRIEGPLTGGAVIGGEIALDRTELRVPSGGGISLGELPDIRHVNEPAAVAETRRRAGLTGNTATSAVSFPLDLTIRAPNRIFVRGRGLDAELGGEVRLGGTTANVTASGFFELIRGRLDILGRRIDLTRGLIDLRGALDPYINFVAETRSDDILVRVILEGLASDPSVRFESEPDLPQEEAVARLLFRRGLDSISPLQAAELVAAAATLSGQRSGGLTGGLRRALGLSDLDIAETEDGTTELRIGGYLSDNIYSQVTADNEGRQEINLNLDLTPSITIKGRADTTGETGIGIFFEKDY
jgi:translocation and assembly module TamB